MRKLQLFLFILLFSFVLLNSQVPEYLSETLQLILDAQQSGVDIPGTSAAIYVHNMGIWAGTSGDSFTGTPLSCDMLMGIGSNTKTFTAALMLQLADQGVLSLDDSLHQWLPSFEYIHENIKIEQLLKHSSGISDFWTLEYVEAVFENPDSVWSPEDVLAFIGPPLFYHGTNVSYSNTNFTLAGMIIESATGEQYHTLIRDYILDPLNLNSTFLEGFEQIPIDSAHPWHLGQDVYDVPRTAVTTAAFSAGCIKSTPSDMVKWFDNLFNQQFLAPESMSEMIDFIPMYGSNVSGSGCGIFRLYHNSRIYYFHTGNIRGYSSYTLYDTETKHSVSVLRNDTFIDCEAMVFTLSETISALVPYEDKIIDENSSILVDSFQNYPNPFNPSTLISFEVSEQCEIEFEIFNTKGQKIKTLIKETYPRGEYSILWNGEDDQGIQVSSGVYFNMLKINGKNYDLKKMLLLK